MFDALNTTVQKGAHKRGVASFGVGCTKDSKRDIDKFEVAFPDIPGSPLAVWVEENGEALRSLERALTAAQFQLMMLRNAKARDNKEDFAKHLKINLAEEDEDEFEPEENEGEADCQFEDLTPRYPVLQMNNDEINQYVCMYVFFFCKTCIFPGIFPASSKGCWKWKLEQERNGVFGRARQRLQVLRHFKGLSLVIIKYIL